MYQTSSSLLGVKKMLHQLPHVKFYVYGFGIDEQDKNVTFKSFSEDGFVNDLANKVLFGILKKKLKSIKNLSSINK